jgi:predicted nucleic acid-binding protein
VNKALLNTDMLSEIGQGIDHLNVARNATAYRNVFGRYTLSVISIMEIVRGFQKMQSPRRLKRFLAAIASEEILAFDQPAAELAGRMAGDLDRIGQPIGRADPMIAAIALMHGPELVTGNTAHYQRIQQLGYPLALVNWR